VSGGGSAGHISPILATVDALRRLDKDAEILYIGTSRGMEAKIATGAGLEFSSIPAGKFRRNPSASSVSKIFNVSTLGLNARDSVRFVAGIGKALTILRRFKPDVVFVKGGFVGLPVGLAAKTLRIPLVIHESDVSPGLTNRVLSKWARVIAVGFPVDKYKQWPHEKLIFTGVPVREGLMGAHRLEGLKLLKLDDKLPVVLVTGGSQGAQTVNDVVVDSLAGLLEFSQVVHLTGEQEIDSIKFRVKRLNLAHPERYHPYAFLHKEMIYALAAADVAVSRAGATTIAELAALSKPTVLIPNNLMAGHQVMNAKVISRQDAVRVIYEERLKPAVLIAEVKRLVDSEEERERLGKALHAYARLDAVDLLANEIVKIGRERADHDAEE
jgi:UDP-N-acetylglucosamine--N-acetylmuramyl-(pentapeptide) pyrophosphoryl-undecaprenol N-acetylglucosamine transferase